MSDKATANRIPIREGLFTTLLSPLEDVQLVGSKCHDCGEVGLGTSSSCQNCAGTNMEVIPLSAEGKVWTCTVIRNRPPGDYKGPDNPYLPLAEGLVELPEGIRVLSPLGHDLDKIKIGVDVRLKVYPLYTNDDGKEVIAFKYEPI